MIKITELSLQKAQLVFRDVIFDKFITANIPFFGLGVAIDTECSNEYDVLLIALHMDIFDEPQIIPLSMKNIVEKHQYVEEFAENITKLLKASLQKRP